MPEERKLVSILFYDHARRILPAYGGTLEKFIGAAVMAIFGLNQSHGDDAERALALREAIAKDEILNGIFHLRIGVNTGEVVATGDPSSGEERSILQAASVASRAFRTSLLETVMDQYSESEIAEALDGLLAHDMIVQIEHQRYNFRHILVRDVASRGERIRLHSKIALWLEASAGEHLDEYIEIIASHYREAIQLSRQSAVPLTLPFKTEDAAHIFARAGVLAGHTGSYAETQSQMQMAMSLTSEHKRMQLYERLGDSVLWGEIPNEAYRKALAYWRASDEQDPRIGARLIRKVLIASTWDIVFHTAFTSGRWDEMEQFRPKLDEIRELIQYDHVASAHLMRGYLSLLWLTLAREDHPLIDGMATIVRKYGEAHGPNFLPYVEALLASDLQHFTLDVEKQVEDTLLMGLFQFGGENGQATSASWSALAWCWHTWVIGCICASWKRLNRN